MCFVCALSCQQNVFKSILIKPRDIEVLHETPFTVHTKTALRVKLISTSLLYDLPMNLRTKFSVANSVTVCKSLRVCANFVQILMEICMRAN